MFFSQIAEFLPRRVFDRMVDKYHGNKYVRFFTCWNQLLSMLFGQLSGRESLRDLMIGLDAHKSKFYHLGFGKSVTRSNLAKANEKRNCKIFEEFAYQMIDLARECSLTKDFELDIKANVYAFDSSTIDLCLSVFWWAEFRKTKGAIKLHAMLDVKTSIPCYIHITKAWFMMLISWIILDMKTVDIISLTVAILISYDFIKYIDMRLTLLLVPDQIPDLNVCTQIK